MAVLAAPPHLQFFDDNGDPLNGGLVYTYSAGTTTPKATYTDSTGATENTNPVVLDSAGRPEPGGSIWLNGSYKFVVKDSGGTTITTTDNVTSFTTTAAAANAYFESFSGNASDTVFTTSQDLGTDENAVMVWVDAGGGAGYDIQDPTADYTIDGTSLTFTSAPASGTGNIFVMAPSTLVNAAAQSASAAASSATAASNSATAAALSESGVGERQTMASNAAFRCTTEADRAETEADRAEAAADSASFTLDDAIRGSWYYG